MDSEELKRNLTLVGIYSICYKRLTMKFSKDFLYS